MKKIYVLGLMILLVFISNSIFSQITVVNAVAVDGDSNGRYGTVEIEFSIPVTDADIKDPGDRDDWEFSLDPGFSSVLTPSGFATDVTYIATADVANDQYIRFSFGTEFASSNGPIYFRYTQEGDVVWDSATGSTSYLYNFAFKTAVDIAPPVITSVTSNATGAGVLKVGQSIIFTVDFEDPVPDPEIIMAPLKYNNRDLNWSTSNGGDTYFGTYTVVEGDFDQTSVLQLTGVTAEDKYGNVSSPFDGTDVAKTIDANTPFISSVTSDADVVDTLIVGDSIVFTVDILLDDPNLTITPLKYNGQDLNWTALSGGSSYEGKYFVTEGDQDRTTPLQLTGVKATDPAGNISNTVDGSDILKKIDANTPSINTVTSDATSAGTLIVGDKITFTVDVVTSDANLLVTPATYNSRALNWYTTDGGSTYKGIYTVTDGDLDQSSPLQLLGVKLTDPAGNESSIVNGGDVLKTIDANKPYISSVTSDADIVDTLIVRDSIVFTVDILLDDPNLTITPLKYNGQDLNWTSLSGGSLYEGKYFVTEGDQDRTTPLQLTGVKATDPAGNISNTVDGSDVLKKIDANTPAINTVTSDATAAGAIIIGDKITFTVDVVTSDANLLVTPSTYNGRALNWYTTDGGSTYKGIYTVTDGDLDQSSPLQLLGVKLTDPAGNESSIVDGGDVLKTIDANKPFISSLLLKDESKKIGDQDTLYITINSDSDFSNYSLVSGTIAGYSISSIEPIDATTINAYFSITTRTYEIDSSETIQVSNLQLADGAGNVSNIINSNVANAKHAIFSKKPSVDISGNESICNGDSIEVPVFLSGHAPFSITYTDGTTPKTVNSINSSLYKLKIIADNSIGNPINYTITNVSDITGNSNTAIKGPFVLNIYSLPNAFFLNPNDGNTFDISIDSVHLSASPSGAGGIFSGDAVTPGYEMFNPKLAGVGFHSLYYNYTDVNGCKDADTITVEVIEGGTIIFNQGKDIYCSYTDTFSVVGFNNLSLIGSFKIQGDPAGGIFDNGDNTAMIYPSNLIAGSYNIIYSYGTSPVVNIVRSFSVEQVGNTISFTPIGNKCEDYSTITIEAKNLSPLGGIGNFTFSNAGVDLHETNNGNNIYISPGDLTPNTYSMEYFYLTSNGCSSDTLIENFNVFSLPTVNLTMDALYDINGGTHLISGSPLSPPGDFSPSFMIDNSNGTATFDPQIAGLGTKNAYYTYTDLNGCTNIDTATFTINESQGDIYGLNQFDSHYQYCYYNGLSDTIWAVPLNGDGLPGTFYIDGHAITNIVGKDSIAFKPSDYSAGDHSLKFSYTNGTVVFNISKSFNIDSIDELDIIGLEDNYCEDDDRQIVLTGIYTGDPGVGVFSGNGITGNKFNPSDANLYNNTITYQFTRASSGCKRSVDSTTTVNKVPFTQFILDKTCISGRQDSVLFEADTLMSDNVTTWNWTVDNTITSRSSTKETPKFSLVEQVKNFISLTLTSDKGCSAVKESSIFIGSVVDLDFSWDNECLGSTVNFKVLQSTEAAGVDSIKWQFGGNGIVDSTDIYNPKFTYSEAGGYDVVYQEYTSSCGLISETKKINIRPSIVLGTSEYLEDFEQNPDITGWAVDVQESTSNYTWEWGVPNGTKINSAASGSNAYVTNLDGKYNTGERSILSSPCFDFRNTEKPMIKFDFISDLELNRDGVILEYSVEKDKWETIGLYGQGVKWYNSFNITGSNLGQPTGWTGNGISLNAADASSWSNAKYWLDDLKNEAGVRFRFVLGTDDYNVAEGFGLDNIWIGERNRLVLLEHFANPAEDDFNNTQNIISDILQENPEDAVSVQYYTSFPTMNEINEFYAAGPSARSLYYGISQVPYSIVDGGDRKFNYSSTNTLESSDVKRRMLQDSKFEINVKQGVSGSNFNISASIKAIATVDETNLSARVLVVEKSIQSGSETYHNVLRAMLPDPAGTQVERSWEVDDSVKIFQTWTIPETVNADSLFTIVFLQNTGTKEIYQTAFTSEFGTVTGSNEFIELNQIEYIIYPNPVSDLLHVKFINDLKYDLNIRLYSSTGILLKESILNQGSNSADVEMDDFPVGIYYLQISSSNKLVNTKKIIKVN